MFLQHAPRSASEQINHLPVAGLFFNQVQIEIPEVLLLKQFYFMIIKNVGLLLYIASFRGAGMQHRIEATVWVLLF